ncbi:terminase small subunit [Sporosarcina sp. FSL K6-5500]|uniref:terminase small subunit n=1 Tax=Sporosarcina sp. FSL K6-5500 TaxID=2921558 RepID=UPI0030F6851A
MPNWEEIQREWETTKITLAALAEKHDVKLGTLKSRKSREAWVRGPSVKDATKKKKDATIFKRMQPKEAVVESDDLTDKQRLFCIYYIKSFNATMAAIKAGYARNSAHVEGSRLLRNVKVAAEVRRLKGEMQQGIFIDAMDVLNKYIQIAFADITDFVDFGSVTREQLHPETGRVMMDAEFKPITYKEGYVDFKPSDEVDGTIITELKLGRDGVVVKLADKMKALDMLTKYFDMLPDHFKRQIETEKLKIAHAKAFGNEDPEQYEDDGFNEALDATTLEVWGNAGNPTESED